MNLILKDPVIVNLVFCKGQAWMSLFEGAKSEVNLMSQWAIDGVGRSKDIFNALRAAVKRDVRLRLLYNTHADAKYEIFLELNSEFSHFL